MGERRRLLVRVLPGKSVPYADDTTVPEESAPRRSVVLPAAGIALVRFALGEVEQPAEVPPNPLAGRHQIRDTDHRLVDQRP